MDRFSPGWAARWGGNQRDRGRDWNSRYLPEEPPHRNRDPWIERYGRYLTYEHKRLGGGLISSNLVACVAANYREFQANGDRRARYQSWVAIRLLCRWLIQLEDRNS